MVINLDSDEYRNLQTPLEQSGVFICDHEGKCGATCPCRLNKTTCREACKCPSDCPHRFPHCDCERSCTKGCVCIDRGRECVSGKCRRGRCINDGQGRCHSFFPLKPYISLWVGKSTIPFAGNGLFTHDVIKTHQCLGRYTGNILPDAEIESDGRAVVTAFAVAKGKQPRFPLFALTNAYIRHVDTRYRSWQLAVLGQPSPTWKKSQRCIQDG